MKIPKFCKDYAEDSTVMKRVKMKNIHASSTYCIEYWNKIRLLILTKNNGVVLFMKGPKLSLSENTTIVESTSH